MQKHRLSLLKTLIGFVANVFKVCRCESTSILKSYLIVNKPVRLNSKAGWFSLF